MKPRQSLIRHLKPHLDSIAVITSLAAVAYTDELGSLTDTDLAVLAALRRSNALLKNATLSDIQAYLSELDDNQQIGLISNVKGILHEMEFVRLENTDGDNVYASYFTGTNHPDTDIELTDVVSGECWEVQLKATDSSPYVQDWLDNHPDGHIAVTEELAKKMGLDSSGLTNEELTTDTTHFVDKLLEADEADTLWDYLPILSALSISFSVWELWQRQQRGEITIDQFQQLAAWLTGTKASKTIILGTLLSTPVIGAIIGVVLILNFMTSVARHS